MKKIIVYLSITLFTVFVSVMELRADNNHFRFQGRLTDSQGQPIAGTPQVSFEIFNALSGGDRVWGPSPFTNVTANEAGLFATDVGPFTSADFSSQQDLFLQVTVKGGTSQTPQKLSPRQQLTRVPFAFHAQQAEQSLVADAVRGASIGKNEIQPSAVGSDELIDYAIESIDISTAVTTHLIPSGMIAMFARSCPTGWTRFDLLDDRFPIGVSTFTALTGGSRSINGLSTTEAGGHSHTVNSHNHSAGNLTAIASPQFNCPLRSQGGHCVNFTDHTHEIQGQTGNASPETNSQGHHKHDVTSDGSWLPPYLGVVYCEKN